MTIQRLREILKTIGEFKGVTSIIDKLDEENKLLRKFLWLNHGCDTDYLYGDYGEMQCSKCVMDFKRQDVRFILKQIDDKNAKKFLKTLSKLYKK